MKFLHSMIRVRDVAASLHFYCDLLGLKEQRRIESAAGRFTLIFLTTAPGQAEIELTYNWDVPDSYGSGRNFGHLAFEVEDIYALCAKLVASGITINRPPRDGRMAFVRSPDDISVELLQAGSAQPPAAPWAAMANTGVW